MLGCLNKKTPHIFYHETKKVCFSLILPADKRAAGNSVLGHPQAVRTDRQTPPPRILSVSVHCKAKYILPLCDSGFGYMTSSDQWAANRPKASRDLSIHLHVPIRALLTL